MSRNIVVIDLTSPVELEPAQPAPVTLVLPVFVQSAPVKPEPVVPVVPVKPEPVTLVVPEPAPVKPAAHERADTESDSDGESTGVGASGVLPSSSLDTSSGEKKGPAWTEAQLHLLKTEGEHSTTTRQPVDNEALAGKLTGMGNEHVSAADVAAWMLVHGYTEFSGRRTPVNWTNDQMVWLGMDSDSRRQGACHMTDENLAKKLNELGGGDVTAADVAEWMQNMDYYVATESTGRVNWTSEQLTWLDIEASSRKKGGHMGDQELANMLQAVGGMTVTAADVAEWMQTHVQSKASRTKGAEPGVKTGRRMYNNHQKKILEEELDKPGWKERASEIAERVDGLQGGREVSAKDVISWMRSRQKEWDTQTTIIMKEPEPNSDFKRRLEMISDPGQCEPDDQERTSKRKFYNRMQQEFLEVQFNKIENFEQHLQYNVIAEMVDKLDGGREVEEKDVKPWMNARRKRGKPY